MLVSSILVAIRASQSRADAYAEIGSAIRRCFRRATASLHRRKIPDRGAIIKAINFLHSRTFVDELYEKVSPIRDREALRARISEELDKALIPAVALMARRSDLFRYEIKVMCEATALH